MTLLLEPTFAADSLHSRTVLAQPTGHPKLDPCLRWFLLPVGRSRKWSPELETLLIRCLAARGSQRLSALHSWPRDIRSRAPCPVVGNSTPFLASCSGDDCCCRDSGWTRSSPTPSSTSALAAVGHLFANCAGQCPNPELSMSLSLGGQSPEQPRYSPCVTQARALDAEQH